MQSAADTTTGTREKALALNLDATRYGTFAEIGGGQEVARWFFAVGGAAGTVAKTISAYDMAVSDGLYGATKAAFENLLLSYADEVRNLTKVRVAGGRLSTSRRPPALRQTCAATRRTPRSAPPAR